ncbi:tetratricopeptide repeat protein [Pseudomonas putida]
MAKAPRKKSAKVVTTSGSAEAKSNRKNVASPVSTGDRGGSFERRVQAVRLLAMCLGSPCPGARDGYTITRLLFQGRVFDHDTDDLIIYLRHPRTGQNAKQCLQMKRSLKPTDNKIFNEAVGLAWLDFSKPGFQRNLDELLIVYHSSSTSSMQGAVEVVRHAMVSSSADDWHVRVHAERFSNESNRKAYAAIKRAVELQNGSEVEKTDLYPFVLHLKFMPHDLDSDRSMEVDTQKQLISQRIFSRQSSDVWASLQATCAELNSSAGEISVETAERHLGALALEFEHTRSIWNGFHSDQGFGFSGVAGKASAALPLTPDTHGRFAELSTQSTAAQGLLMADDLPSALAQSADTFISKQLDRITEGQREHRYQDSLRQLELLESGLGDFDAHQKARWYLLRGLSFWHLGNDEAAATDFDSAASLCDSDDRIAAALVRAHMLRGQYESAVEIGRALLARFPESFHVWAVTTNARLLAGERLHSEDEIPGIFADKAAAWQLLACSLSGMDDEEGAVRVIGIALGKQDCSFFILESYLRLAIRLVTQDETRVNLRALSANQTEVLVDAMSRFDDRDNTLWSSQSPKTVSEVISHLAYAMVLLQRPAEAVELIKQAKMRGAGVTDAITRIEIEAMCDLQQWNEVTDQFTGALGTVPDESLLRFGHACMAQSRHDLLQLARDEAARRSESEIATRVAAMLRHLSWEMLLQAEGAAAVRTELAECGISQATTNVIDLCFASRACENDEALRNRYVDRIAELAPECTQPQELAMAARAMQRAHRYEDAISLFERLLPIDAFSPLHVDLLHCYVLAGRQAQARNLLDSMPSTWLNSPEAREQALFLFNSAGDWARMREVVELTVSENQNDANPWLTLIRVAACEGVLDLDVLISRIPDQLGGAPNELLLLASIEMRHGQVEKALARIAHTMRNNLADVELAATHVKVMLTLSEEADEIMGKVHETLAEVEPGVCVELEDDQGNLRHVSIDSRDSTYPSVGEFISPDSEFALRLIGLKVSETVTFSYLMGTQILQVRRITTLHQRLLELSHNRVRESVIPSKTLVSMKIPTDSKGEMDFTVFLRQLDQYQSQGENILKVYEQNPLTLGLLADRLGKDIIDLVRGWPLDGPCLQVSTVTGLAHDVLPCPLLGSIWVIDLSMLTQLAMLGLLDVLGHLPTVYVSTATRRALDMKMEMTSSFRKSGTMYTHEGQLGFYEETEADHARDQAFLSSIDIAISSFCKVVPAYGPLHPTPELHRLRDVLDMEEHASLMLCKEYEAALLSLDARMRQLASALDLHSASPQMLLKGMQDEGVLRGVEYSCALIKMIATHRSFVSVGIPNLIAMMDQGLSFANMGMKSLRRYLAIPDVDFDSAAFTIIGFISQMFLTGRCNFPMLLELVSHLLEPLFRHPQCPADFLNRSLEGFSPLQAYGFTPRYFALIKRMLISAKEASQRPDEARDLNARIVFLRVAPLYSIEDESVLLARALPLKHRQGELASSEQADVGVGNELEDAARKQASVDTISQTESQVKTAEVDRE